jgi:C4-dicarboxylate transporter, DctM subunit
VNEVVVGIVILFLLLGFFLTGIELAFAMSLLGFVGFAMLVSVKGAMNMLGKELFNSFASYGLTVIPLFVLMGQIAFNAGIAKRLYESAHKFMGHVPGGLALATVAGVTIFKAICGSTAATTATFAGVAVPEMDRFGYSRKLSTGIVAVAGTLGAILPPSVILIVFGMITEQPIGKLFMAGILPGLLLSALFAIVIIGWCRINPAIGPRSEPFTWKARIGSLPEVMWPVIVFILMVGGMMVGLFTPTEAGSVGTVAVFLLAVFKKDLNFGGFTKSIAESLRTSCMVLMLVAGSGILGRCLAVTGIPQIAAEWITQLPAPRYLIMILIALVYLIGGSFIDDLAFMILATPIFYPSMLKLGYDPLWAGIMICLTVMIGAVIPPVAMNVFIVRNITKVPISVIYSGVYPFLISLVLLAILLFLFPEIALFLPQALMK